MLDEYFKNIDIPNYQQINDFFNFCDSKKVGLTGANPKDLQKVQQFLAAAITGLNSEQTVLQTSISGLKSQKETLLASISGLKSEKETLLASIADLRSEKETLQDSIETQLLNQNNLSTNLNLFDERLITFNTEFDGLNLLLQNPTLNLYAADSIKKIIPFKKKTKLFITLNGREQWNAPPTSSKLTINGLVSSRLDINNKKPEYKAAGKWKNITKYFKPVLSNISGRWCIELDNRKLKDFPLDYWDEFVIRYDDLTTWSGEIIHWSWGTTLSINNQNIQGSANNLKDTVKNIKNILDSFTPITELNRQ